MPRFFPWLLPLSLIVACAAPVESSLGSQEPSLDDEDGAPYVPMAGGKADGFVHSAAPLTFDAACQGGDRLTIAAVGDVLLHGPLQRQAFEDPRGFRSLWADVAPLLEQADITYANLEGPTAAGVNTRGQDVRDPGLVFGVDDVYTSYPMFNYHPSLVTDLMAAGIDVVSTANNHSLDRRALGVDRTIDALTEAGLPFTGTRRSSATDRDWVTVTRARSFSLAWIACTYGTNGIPDAKDQVFHCYQDRAELLTLIEATAARDDVDAVITTPHWGLEYNAMPRQQQVDLAHDMLEAGALAVIGAHPHVLQPWQRYRTSDGRDTFVIYSLGNFVSNQTGLAKRSTLLLYLGLVRGNDGEVQITGARYVPLYMLRSGAREIVALDPSDGRHTDSLDLTASLFGGYNLMGADERLVPDPQCNDGWEPPRLTPSFVGDACRDNSECGFADGSFCHSAGFCTTPCTGYCDERVGRPGTFCVADGERGICVSKAGDGNAMCDGVPGTRPAEVSRFLGEPGVVDAVALVCTP